MTTNKKFSFDIQMFADTVISASSGHLSVAGASFSSLGANLWGLSSASNANISDTQVTGSVVISTGASCALAGIASVAAVGNNATLGLPASENTLSWNSVKGSVSVASFTGFSQLGLSIASNTNNAQIVLTGEGATNKLTKATVTQGGVVFGTVGQDWSVAGGASVGLGEDVVAVEGEKVTLKGSGSQYLDFAMGSGSLAFTGTFASLKADSIVFGGVGGASLGKEGSNYVLTKNATASTEDNITVNSAVFGLSSGAEAVITGAGENASVVAIDALRSGGTWKLGAATNVTLAGKENWVFSTKDAQLTADTTGTKAVFATLSGGTATLKNDSGISNALTFNGAGWSFAGVSSVSFDATGNISGLTGGGSIALTTEAAASVGTGAGDALKVATGAVVTLVEGHITKVAGGLSASSEWKVGASKVVLDPTEGNDFTIEFAGKAADSVYGVLTADSTGAAISSVTSLTGNAVVTTAGFSATSADAAGSLAVMGKNWTIAGDHDGAVAFDTLGNASVDGTAFNVTGDAGAIVSVGGATAGLSGAVINGANVSISGNNNASLAFGLEAAGTGAGIASITGLGESAAVTVSGDNTFAVATKYANYNVTTSSTSDSLTAFKVVDTNKNDAKLVFDVEANGSYAVTGGNALFNLLIPTSDVDNSTETSATTVTINGYTVDLKPTAGETVQIESKDGDITAVTMKAGDAITTSGDQEFAVVVNTADYTSTTSTDTVVITVNDTKISVAASVLANSDSTTLNVDQSGDTAKVTITGGLATSANYSVTSGVYKVGQNAADTITDAEGYITVASGGAATVENSSTKAINEELNSAISTLAGDTTGSAISAYQTFYNLSNAKIQTNIANWASDSATVPTDGKENTGYNIYADTTLGSAVKYVTLEAMQSMASAPIIIANNEATSLATAVIDLSNSTTVDHQVVIGAGSNAVTANHTVIGAGKADTVIFGENATGTNLAKGGDGADYLVNKGKKASLIGGDGNDTIVANAGDYVEGGDGVDFFKDSAAYQINDYSVEDGDVIVASKLPANGVTKLNQLTLSGNVVQVNGGAKVTLGSEYDENNSMAAIIAGADGSTANAKYVAWTSNYGSTVDASARTSSEPAIIIGSHNEGAGDLLMGGAGKDTISAGGNDSVLSGAGNDYIYLSDASVANGELGAMVALAAGKNTVENWQEGFDNEAGANILYHEGGADGISLKSSSGYVTAYSSDGSLTFANSSNEDTFSFLAGIPTDDEEDNGLDKVTFIKSGKTAEVDADNLVADVYYGEKKNGISFTSGVEKELEINLGGEAFSNVVSVSAANKNTATIIGAEGSVKEFVTVSGAAADGARKTVSLGGGNDSIVSGGTASTAAGNTFYFAAGDGKDTISNFGFYQAADADIEAADLVYINNSTGEWIANGGGVKGTTKGVEISTTASDKVILSGASANDVVRVQFNDSDAVFNVKVGNSSSTSNFVYADNAQLYYGNANKGKDTLSFNAEADKAVGVWLTQSLANAGYKDSNGNTYIGVGAVNATNLTNASATLVGADGENNILTAAGSGSATSLWGGMGGKNSLVGGAGKDTFIFFQGYGNDDTISGCTASQEDYVWLPNVSVNDLDFTKMTAGNNYGISSGKIELTMKDGSKLTVASPGTTTNITLSDGEYVANTRTKAWSVA